MSKFKNILAGMLLTASINVNAIGNSESDDSILNIQKIINENFKNDVNKCVEVNKGVVTLITTDNILSKMSPYENSLLLIYNVLAKSLIKDVSNQVDVLLPKIKNNCKIETLELYKSFYGKN